MQTKCSQMCLGKKQHTFREKITRRPLCHQYRGLHYHLLPRACGPGRPHKAAMDKSAAGGGSQPSAPPAVASHHPRWRSRGRGATLNPARGAPSISQLAPKRTNSQERPQLRAAAYGRRPTRAGRDRGIRPPPCPAKPRLWRGGEAAGPPTSRGGPSAPRGPR